VASPETFGYTLVFCRLVEYSVHDNSNKYQATYIKLTARKWVGTLKYHNVYTNSMEQDPS